MMPFAKIIGTGAYLPPNVVSNDQLAAELAEKGVETSDPWIVERNGIRQRQLADKGARGSDLATRAAQQALERAAISADSLDLLIVGTSTTDVICPSTHCLVQ